MLKFKQLSHNYFIYYKVFVAYVQKASNKLVIGHWVNEKAIFERNVHKYEEVN